MLIAVNDNMTGDEAIQVREYQQLFTLASPGCKNEEERHGAIIRSSTFCARLQINVEQAHCTSKD